MFDRSAILRAAHAQARWLIAQAVYPEPYRVTFARALRSEWRSAKQEVAYAAQMAELETEEAAHPIPADVAAEAAAIRAAAWFEPITAAGTRRMIEQLAAASAMIEVARLANLGAHQ